MTDNDGAQPDAPTEVARESWDITTNLGSTALAVATQRATETEQQEFPLVTGVLRRSAPSD